VTVNNGYQMRAWYDIVGIDRRSIEDSRGIAETVDSIGGLIHREHARGIDSARIVLAGFSQGGAMALHLATRHPDRFAGVIALSCYLPLARELSKSRNAANQSTPIFMAHGTQDPVVPYMLGEESRRLLEDAGFSIEWHGYPMQHSLCADEVTDLRAWLKRAFAAA
jgi:phospholipase/carboxylesterase